MDYLGWVLETNPAFFHSFKPDGPANDLFLENFTHVPISTLRQFSKKPSFFGCPSDLKLFWSVEKFETKQITDRSGWAVCPDHRTRIGGFRLSAGARDLDAIQ